MSERLSDSEQFPGIGFVCGTQDDSDPAVEVPEFKPAEDIEVEEDETEED